MKAYFASEFLGIFNELFSCVVLAYLFISLIDVMEISC